MNRRKFLATSGLCGAAIAFTMGPVGAEDSERDRFQLSDQGCGRATGYAEANKIVTWQGKTHVTYLDSPPEGFQVRIRTLDHATGTWSPAHTVGEAYDNHGGPALSVDSKGYLHIIYYPHHHPMRYKKSLRPNDASEWAEAETIDDLLTYPTLVIDDSDTLYLTCRQRDYKKVWRSNLYTKKTSGTWEGPHTILEAEKTGYAHFMDALAWSHDKKLLHLVTRIHDGKPARGHTIGYLRSADRGQTWTDHKGVAVPLPATAATIDIVRQNRDGTGPGMRTGGLAVAPDGRPFILCSDQDVRPADTWIASPGEDGNWQSRSLRDALPDAYKDWGIFVPGGITFNEAGTLFVVLTMFRPGRKENTSGWGHPHCEVIAFESHDLGASFTARLLSTPDSTVANWLANIERPTGHNVINKRPGVIYTGGGRGEGLKDVLSNKVHWVAL